MTRPKHLFGVLHLVWLGYTPAAHPKRGTPTGGGTHLKPGSSVGLDQSVHPQGRPARSALPSSQRCCHRHRHRRCRVCSACLSLIEHGMYRGAPRRQDRHTERLPTLLQRGIRPCPSSSRPSIVSILSDPWYGARAKAWQTPACRSRQVEGARLLVSTRPRWRRWRQRGREGAWSGWPRAHHDGGGSTAPGAVDTPTRQCHMTLPPWTQRPPESTCPPTRAPGPATADA